MPLKGFSLRNFRNCLSALKKYYISPVSIARQMFVDVCVSVCVCVRAQKASYKKKTLFEKKRSKKERRGEHSLMEVLHARRLALSEAPPEAGDAHTGVAYLGGLSTLVSCC